MSRMLDQLRLLLWKNFLLKRRQPSHVCRLQSRSSVCSRPQQMLSLLPLVLLVGMVTMADASAGDRDPAYTACRQRCGVGTCTHGDRDMTTTATVWTVSGLAWTCEDNCGYVCIHAVTEDRIASGLPVLQYHGKWPFYRLWSFVQEPASVLFSLLNLLANVAGLALLSRKPWSRDYAMSGLSRWHCVISCNAWLWSSVFHSRDLVWTERLDYFSATAMVLFSAYCSLVRMAMLGRPVARVAVALLLLLMFGAHVGYLSLVKFDYGYNMLANVSVGLVNMSLWLVWCARHYSRQPYVWKCAAVLLSTAALMLLELGDFAPLWFVLDAHSLWHLGTVPLPLLWYSFLGDDARFLAGEHKKVD
ncbi:post-GPI attachment to proteins factor 3-like [Sycon ciliatum]|uniref:post-GPI attachment to proteins factor 3-like n=1 Tax=Sycon ciliatum TaxID=27933 RepID=UPI0031F5F59E